MYMFKYPLSNLVCLLYKPVSALTAWPWTQINPIQSSLPPLSALTPYPIRSLSISLAFQFHSATTLKYFVPCLILVSLFLSILICFYCILSVLCLAVLVTICSFCFNTKAVSKSCICHIRALKQIKLEVHGRARREADRRRKSECQINFRKTKFLSQ